uniref:VWFC domain-containing protein n=1 Tax=Panagrolaimus davidi TaxID=227884 RepID=A0A914QMJ4_9BILA
MGIWYHCYRLACPVLDCPNNLIKQIPNKCCPECIHPSPREYRTTVPQNPRIQGYCTFQIRRYEIGDFWHHDPCTRCHCQSGGIQCRRFTCPIRQCHKSAKLLFRKNICCPFCGYSISKNESNNFTNYSEFRSEKIADKQNFGIENSGKITTCIHKLPNGNVLIRKHNSFWKANDCLNCYCRLGKTKCERENCFPQEPFTCPKGSKKIKLIGKCCKFCEQYESTCTIFGGSNYETFDGLNFTFNGNKSYVLTQECGFDDENEIDGDEQLPNFSVTAHNMQNSKNNEEIYTGRISIILKIQNSQRPLILQIGNKVLKKFKIFH